MDIVGYADRFSASPGQTIRFMVSCAASEYRAQLVRLIHGDTNPTGPGLKEESVVSDIERTYRGRVQEIRTGSYVIVQNVPELDAAEGLTIQAWVFPTGPLGLRQGLVGAGRQGSGCGLSISEKGELEFRAETDSGSVSVKSGVAMRLNTWYFVAVAVCPERSVVSLYQQPVQEWPKDPSLAHVEQDLPARFSLRPLQSPILIGALGHEGSHPVSHHFNGKIDRPRIFSTRLTSQEIDALRCGTRPDLVSGALLAAWDFAVMPGSSEARDTGPYSLHGRVVNIPARAVTGYNWTGICSDFNRCPEHYGAIHFHDDDLEDAGWAVDFALTIGSDVPSGVYAAKIATDDAVDYIPFFVRPPEGAAHAEILFLAPTLSYMAYGNEHLPSRDERRRAALQLELDELLSLGSDYERSIFEYMIKNKLSSLYDFHSDGTGVAYTSRLRPIVNFRPRYNKPLFRFKAPHQFNEDLYLVDWLSHKNFKFDCATDEDLHFEGEDLLKRYRVVLTGSHPEYWTEPMFTALERYLKDGGRIMYLGGNGFYWVTSLDPERPHVVEVRRQAGMRTWEASPGELFHSTTGELGGLWRHRGKAPQRILGIGTISAGAEPARPYRRQPDSHDPRVAFIFEGIEENELLGDFGLHLGGAAGWELDRIDDGLGTPPGTFLLASSFGHSDDYQLAVEELWEASPKVGGRDRPDIRADIVYVPYPCGGAAFSVGSISFLGSLSHNGYDNNISRMTENVLRAFCAPELPSLDQEPGRE